jgi:hypothetical protein
MVKATKYIVNDSIHANLPKDLNSLTFQGLFTYLRKSLQIKYTRSIHIDSILKKCKGKFFKAVNDCLRKCLKINIKKLPQSYVTNISIDYNKKYLDFTIKDLYSHFKLAQYSMEVILQKDYCVKGKENFFKYIYLSKITDLYLEYLQSKRYKKECEIMKKQKGIKSIFLHQFVAENFINYYSYSKPHLRKLKKINSKESNIENNNNDKNIKINSSEVKKNESGIKFNVINIKNEAKKNYFIINK